jgi:hypothetical protein
MRKYSLAIHDLKVSGNGDTVKILKELLDTFGIQMTVHLVFDNSLSDSPVLLNFLQEKVATNTIEVVFHGLSHRCSENVSKIFVFYHKYQAEYLEDSEFLREKTTKMYLEASTLLGNNLGICPPCWIALKKNLVFFNSLRPAFIETMLYISKQQNKYFSSVVSLGSPGKKELSFLKIIAKNIYYLSLLFKVRRIRVAIHECDLYNPQSMAFFKRMIASLEKQPFRSVLLKELV